MTAREVLLEVLRVLERVAANALVRLRSILVRLGVLADEVTS